MRFGAPMVESRRISAGHSDRGRCGCRARDIGDTRAVPALIGLLDEGDRELLVPVAGALARLGDGRAFEPLVRLLGDDELAVRHGAIGALNSIGHPDMAARMQTLIGDPDPLVRESAVKIAGYFGYAACADGLLERCRDAEEPVRAAALEHVAFLGDDRVLPALARALEHDTPRARAAAAQALAYVDSPHATAARRAVQDPDPWVRYFSAASLGRQADATALPLLERMAQADRLQHVRISAVDAIGALGGEAAAAVLGTLTNSRTRSWRTRGTRDRQPANASALEPLRRALQGPAARAARRRRQRWRDGAVRGGGMSADGRGNASRSRRTAIAA